MGYTHYWTRRDPEEWSMAWPQVVVCAKEITKAAREKGIVVIGLHKDDPIVNEEEIVFNGDPSHETFHLSKRLPDFDFCKTARKPYDAVVTAILLCAAVLAEEGIRVSSDGYWDDWSEGREIVQELFPEFQLAPKLIDN